MSAAAMPPGRLGRAQRADHFSTPITSWNSSPSTERWATSWRLRPSTRWMASSIPGYGQASAALLQGFAHQHILLALLRDEPNGLTRRPGEPAEDGSLPSWTTR